MSLFRAGDPGARLRLIVLPYAGGGTADFRRWTLPEGVELVAAELPGREARLSQRPYRRLDPLLDDLLRDLPTDRPYVLYGHSLGAWIAFELAHRLRAAGKPAPLRLGVGARQAPDRPSDLPPIGRLPRAAFIAGMIQRYNAIPQVLLNRPELLDAFLPALRADVVLFEDYRFTPRPVLDLELRCFHAVDDPTVTVEGVSAWREHSTGAFQLHTVSGGHFFHRTHEQAILDGLLG